MLVENLLILRRGSLSLSPVKQEILTAENTPYRPRGNKGIQPLNFDIAK